MEIKVFATKLLELFVSYVGLLFQESFSAQNLLNLQMNPYAKFPLMKRRRKLSSVNIWKKILLIVSHTGRSQETSFMKLQFYFKKKASSLITLSFVRTFE